MTLIRELRSRTAGAHERLQHLPFHKALVEKKLSPLSVITYLRSLAIIFATLETELSRSSDERLGKFWRSERAKLPLVTRDLQTLGADGQQTIGPAIERALEVVHRIVSDAKSTPLFLLGVLYVTEGSQNGGVQLKRLMAECLNVDGETLTYFGAYAALTPEIWGAFVAQLAEIELTKTEVDQVINGANFAFEGMGKIISSLHPLVTDELRWHASAINPEAGAHAVPQDPEEIQIAFSAGKVAWDRFPYLESRYGDRGKRFTGSDSCWILTLYHLEPALIRKNILWLRGVLSARGLPSVILEFHMGEILRGLCLRWPNRKNEFNAFESVIEELNALRTSQVTQQTWDELSQKYEQSLLQSPGCTLSGAPQLLIAAWADELSGLKGAFSSVESWFIEPMRFSESWILGVKALVNELRGMTK